MLTNIVCLIKTIKRYDSLPSFAAKYTHACTEVLTVINRVERARSIVIVKHKYMLMCNHKIRINLMRSAVGVKLVNEPAPTTVLGRVFQFFTPLFTKKV